MAFALKTTGSKALRAQAAPRKSTVVVKAALGPTTKVRGACLRERLFSMFVN